MVLEYNLHLRSAEILKFIDSYCMLEKKGLMKYIPSQRFWLIDKVSLSKFAGSNAILIAIKVRMIVVMTACLIDYDFSL